MKAVKVELSIPITLLLIQEDRKLLQTKAARTQRSILTSLRTVREGAQATKLRSLFKINLAKPKRALLELSTLLPACKAILMISANPRVSTNSKTQSNKISLHFSRQARKKTSHFFSLTLTLEKNLRRESQSTKGIPQRTLLLSSANNTVRIFRANLLLQIWMKKLRSNLKSSSQPRLGQSSQKSTKNKS